MKIVGVIILLIGLLQIIDIKFNLGLFSQEKVVKYIGKKKEKRIQFFTGVILIIFSLLLLSGLIISTPNSP